VAVADLNGSGRDDIVICQNHDGRSYTTESLVFLGGNSVSEPALHLRSHDARRVLVGHSARQAEAEIVLINHITRSKLGNVDNAVYYGGPDGYRADRCQSLPGWGSVEAVYADLDDDGRADLVFANASENSTDRDPGSYIYLNSEQGFAMQPSVALPTTRAHGVACADLNRNGYLDLVFGGFDNPELLIFYGSPGGWDVEQPARIWMEHEGVLYKEPRWVHLADLNNDGYLDLIVPQSGFDRFFILWGGPERFSMDRCQFLSVFRAVWTQAVDLSGNGYLDLLIGSVAPSGEGPHDSFVYIYWNSAAGLSGSRRTMLPANHVNCMALADFNHNGRLDLFVGSYADGRVRDLDSYIYWNRPGTFFSSADRTRLFTHSASGCLAADLNGNGWSDLVVANHKVWGDHVGYSEVWWNGPDGFSPKRTTRLPTSGPHGMAAVGPGSITTRGPEEYYVSPPFKLPSQAVPREVSWQAEIPPGTWVRAQLRFADSKAGLKEAEWVGPAQESSWFDNHASLRLKDCAGWWMQVRLALGATNSLRTPRVTRLDVRYGVPEKRRGARSG